MCCPQFTVPHFDKIVYRQFTIMRLSASLLVIFISVAATNQEEAGNVVTICFSNNSNFTETVARQSYWRSFKSDNMEFRKLSACYYASLRIITISRKLPKVAATRIMSEMSFFFFAQIYYEIFVIL